MSNRPQFETPYFIQRIKKPWGGNAEPTLQPLGFSKDLNKALGSVLGFDYMGSSEFEFGAVPRCLRAMLEDRHRLMPVEASVGVHPPSFMGVPTEKILVKMGWKLDQMSPLEAKTYFLVPASIQQDMVKWVQACLCAEGRVRLKEVSHFSRSAYLNTWVKKPHPDLSYEMSTIAWLDLDNHAFWTIDRQMFDQVCKLFDIRRPLENWSAKAA